MQNQRVIWAVQYYDPIDKRTRVWCGCNSRKHARMVKKNLVLMDLKDLRVVKYVPAETYKKVGAK